MRRAHNRLLHSPGGGRRVRPFQGSLRQGHSHAARAGVEVVTGIMGKESRQLNAQFITAHTLGRPFITLKWAQTYDGYMGAEGNRPPAHIHTAVIGGCARAKVAASGHHGRHAGRWQPTTRALTNAFGIPEACRYE